MSAARAAAGPPLGADRVWRQILQRPANAACPALFLDRDGTLIDEVCYIQRAGDVRLIAGAAETVAAANRLRLPVVVVTNQAGVGRGYYGWDAFEAVQAQMLSDLAARGARVDAVYASAHHEEARPPYDVADHPACKPNPGMLLMAAEDLALDLARSWMIGDRARDIEAGMRAGLEGALHVATGHGADEGERAACVALAGMHFRVLTAADIAEAPRLVPLLAGN